jgi:hypothetical protein
MLKFEADWQTKCICDEITPMDVVVRNRDLSLLSPDIVIFFFFKQASIFLYNQQLLSVDRAVSTYNTEGNNKKTVS